MSELKNGVNVGVISWNYGELQLFNALMFEAEKFLWTMDKKFFKNYEAKASNFLFGM